MSTDHATARVLKDGPLELRGRMLLAGEAIGEEAWLCRCGASANKPWCDGSHTTSGCSLTGDPPRRDGVALPEACAPLDLSPQPVPQRPLSIAPRRGWRWRAASPEARSRASVEGMSSRRLWKAGR